MIANLPSIKAEYDTVDVVSGMYKTYWHLTGIKPRILGFDCQCSMSYNHQNPQYAYCMMALLFISYVPWTWYVVYTIALRVQLHIQTCHHAPPSSQKPCNRGLLAMPFSWDAIKKSRIWFRKRSMTCRLIREDVY